MATVESPRRTQETGSRARIAALVADNFDLRMTEAQAQHRAFGGHVVDPTAVRVMLAAILAALHGETDPDRLGVDSRGFAAIRAAASASAG